MYRMRRLGMVLAGMLALTGSWMCSPANPLVENSNLLKNPGFEETIEAQYIEGWGLISTSSGGVNTTEGKDGSNCLELCGRGWSKVFTNILRIEKGEKYFLSLYMKTVDVRGEGAYVEIRGTKKDDATGVLLGLGDEKHRLFLLGGTNDWERYQVVISPDAFPEGTTGLRIYLWEKGGRGNAYFDDISLVKEDSNDNLIDNPGFKGKFSNVRIPEGYNVNWWRTSKTQEMSKVVCDDSVFHSGKNSLRFDDGGIGIATTRIKKFDEEGRTIRVSTWIKTENLLRCRTHIVTGFTDANGKYKYVKIPSSPLSGTNDWTYFEKIIKLPAGVPQRMSINLCRNDKGEGTVWFDDVCVEEIKSLR